MRAKVLRNTSGYPDEMTRELNLAIEKIEKTGEYIVTIDTAVSGDTVVFTILHEMPRIECVEIDPTKVISSHAETLKVVDGNAMAAKTPNTLFDEEFFRSISFKIVEKNGSYIKAVSLFDYKKGITPGKQIIKMDTQSWCGMFMVGIYEDGETRKVFDGWVCNQQQLETILTHCIIPNINK